MIKKRLISIYKMLNKHSKIIRLTIAFLLLSFLFYHIDFEKVFSEFNNLNYLILIPFLLYIPALLVSTLRMNLFLNKKERILSLFNIYWISSFFSNFLPSTIGGDSYKILMLKNKHGLKNSLEATIFDRLSGVIGMLLTASILSYIVYQETLNWILTFLPVTLLILLSLFLFILNIINLKMRSIEIIKNSTYKFKINIIPSVFYSILFLFLGAVSLWVYYLMFNQPVNFFIVLSFYSLIQIINLIPLSINALGIREASMVYLFSFVGIPPEASLSIAILSRFIGVIQSSIGGLIYLFER